MGFSAETLYNFELITSNQLSPDGQWIVYAVQRVVRKTEKKPSDLWVVATDGQSAPRRFTWGDAVETAPQWSPDGNSIAFLSNRGDGKQMQIYVLPFAGGEARPLTAFDGSVSSFKWSPDGTSLVVSHREKDAAVKEREQDEQKKKLGIVVHHVTKTRYKYDGVGWLPENHTHLWRVDVASGDAVQLTTGEFDVASFDWSPDGTKIALVANVHADPGSHIDEEQIWEISAETSEPQDVDSLTQITEHSGRISLLAYSPDGATIAYYAAPVKGNWWQSTELFVVPSSGGEATCLTTEADLYVGASSINDAPGGTPTNPPNWSADGTRIRVPVSRHGNQPWISIDVATKEIDPIVADNIIGLAQYDREEQTIGYLRATLDDVGQLFALKDGEAVQLTQMNSWMADEPKCAVEEVWFKSGDGYDLQGWIMTPPDFDPTQTYPSIMEIHGGPMAQYANFFMHEFNFLASQGFVVYFCNPRGGTGYGREHCRSIFGNWGSVDYDDLMAWADYMEAQAYIDSARMGVTGGSYGGLMTSMIIGRTQRFAAACAQRSVTNWTSMYGSADFNQGWEHLCGDPPPWEDIETNWKHSPISYIGNCVTPTLVVHSEADYRCNLEQSEVLFAALRKLGVDSEMVVFPNESHGLSRGGRTDRRVSRLEHMARWFNKYLK